MLRPAILSLVSLTALVVLLGAPALASAPAPRRPLAVTTLADIPPEVVVVGGFKSVASVEADLQRYVPKMHLLSSMGPGAADIDASRPVRFALIDPKRFGALPTLVLSLTPGSNSANRLAAEKSGRIIVTGTPTLYLDHLGPDLVVVSVAGDLFKTHSVFLKKLASWTPQDPIVIEAHVANLKAIYQVELERFLGLIRGLIGKRGEDSKEALDTLIEGVGRAALTIDPGSDHPRISLALTGIVGTRFETGVVADAKRSIGNLLKEVPSDAWLVMVGTAKEGFVDSADEATTKLRELLEKQANARPWTPTEVDDVLGPLKTISAMSRGPIAVWSRTGLPLSFEAVLESPDAVALQTAVIDLAEAMLLRAGDAFFGDQRPPTASETFGLLMSGMTAVGVGVDRKDVRSAEAGMRTASLDLTLDWQRLLAMRGKGEPLDPAHVASVERYAGKNPSLAFAAKGKRFAMAFGQDGAERATALGDSIGSRRRYVGAKPVTSGLGSDPWARDAARSQGYIRMQPTGFARLLEVVGLERHEGVLALAAIEDPLVIVVGAEPPLKRGKPRGGEGARMRFDLVAPAALVALATRAMSPGKKSAEPLGRRIIGPIATVDGVAISSERFYEERARILSLDTLPASRVTAREARIVAELVADALFEQAADKAGIVASEAEVEAILKDYGEHFGDPRRFERQLAVNGSNLAAMTEKLRRQLRAELLVTGKPTFSDAEVRADYESRTSAFRVHAATRVAVVRLGFEQGEPERARAQKRQMLLAAQARIARGLPFEQVAQEVSADPSDADLGFLSDTALETRGLAAAKALAIGAVSEPIEGADGYYLVKVIARRGDRQKSLKEVAPQVRRELRSRAFRNARDAWLEAARARAKIVVYGGYRLPPTSAPELEVPSPD